MDIFSLLKCNMLFYPTHKIYEVEKRKLCFCFSSGAIVSWGILFFIKLNQEFFYKTKLNRKQHLKIMKNIIEKKEKMWKTSNLY